MSYVPLASVKKYLEVIHSADDEVIQDCIDAAESYAANYMNRRAITDEQDCPWTNTDGCECSESSSETDLSTVPHAVVMAIKFITADFYEHRTQTVMGSMTKLPAAEQMLHFYRVGLGV